MNPIHRFNVWFDSQKEPRRFSLFILIMLGWLLPLEIAVSFSSIGTWPSGYSTVPEVTIFGVISAVWLFAVMIIAISRMLPPKK